jgi:hypothetical protein
LIITTARPIGLSYPKPDSYQRVKAVKNRYLTGFQLPPWYDHGKEPQKASERPAVSLHALVGFFFFRRLNRESIALKRIGSSRRSAGLL